MKDIRIDELSAMFAQVAAVMRENEEKLCEMDAQMGDGDLGLTMKKGFSALPDLLNAMGDEQDIGKRLSKAGLKMSTIVPSTMGTLMASGIMEGGKALIGGVQIDAKGYAAYLKGFANGIMKRGKCNVGDRTVLDAVLPAAEKAEQMLSKNPEATLEQVAGAALQGACDGVEATKTMMPKYGKAAVFASRAVGTVDQGAYAGSLMIRGYYEFICRQNRGN